jgi:hypothetical protein
MPLVAERLCRYALNGTYLGRPSVNILDMNINNNGGINSRTADVVEVGGVVLDSFVEHCLGGMAASYTLHSVSFVDLDSADGPTGTITGTGSHTLPLPGGQGGNSYSANSALLVTKQGASARGSRNGRWYLSALTESVVDGNIVDSSHLADMRDILGDMLANLTETADLAAPQYFPVILHTQTVETGGVKEIHYRGFSQIHGFAVSDTVASQRRRVRP